jgi:hypothetical protein
VMFRLERHELASFAFARPPKRPTPADPAAPELERSAEREVGPADALIAARSASGHFPR